MDGFNVIQAFSKIGITTDLRLLLLENEDLRALVNTNIFPIIAPEDTTGSCIFYFRDGGKNDYSMNDIIINQNVIVTFAAMSEDYDISVSIGELIDIIIEGTHINRDGYKYKCKLIKSAEDLIDKKYFQLLQFEIR